ncbi:MAG: family 16 glycoside hydrolase, partial [Planctomycetota bacterium]
TKSVGYVHGVVNRGDGDLSLAERALIEAAGDEFEVVATQDCAIVNPADLAAFDAVVFYTTGELPVSEANRQALLEYVRTGGGFVGIHPATDTFYEFPAYGEMIGGYFNGHPWHQKVGVKVEDGSHPSTVHLGEAFEITDEIYQFRDWDRSKVHVLLSLDVESVDLGKDGVRRDDGDFAITWTKPYGAGRVFYTALGHRPEVWQDERFLAHLLGGIRWAQRDVSRIVPGAVDAEGFTPIFDADHVAGWTQAGPGHFDVEDGVATTVGNMGLWFYDKSYRNFILKLEFRQRKTRSNSGVFIRFPDPGGDPWVAVHQGYEIQIAGDQPSTHTTGAVYSFQAPTAVPLKPAGEWNEYEITGIGKMIYVRLNGQLINVYEGDRGTEGMVGVQNHQDVEDNTVSFRNIRVKELPDDATAYHVLFEGDLAGWRMCGRGNFEREGDALLTLGGMGMLWHERSVRDFILMLDWSVEREKDNAGVFVRFPDPGDDPWVAVHQGYEIQICDVDPPKHRTGSIYGFQDATEVPTHPVGEWNHYEIRVVGQHYEVWVNGRKVNDFTGERSPEGHVGLQNHDARSRVRFRNVRVVELGPR